MKKVADEVGYPLLLKASSGGGGRGMRLVEHERDLINSYNAAYNEALSAFGDGDIYVERFVEKPDAQTAQSYLEEGGYLWNSGMFLLQAGKYL